MKLFCWLIKTETLRGQRIQFLQGSPLIKVVGVFFYYFYCRGILVQKDCFETLQHWEVWSEKDIVL